MAKHNAFREEWLPVPGYEGLYEVSNQGSVRSVPRTSRDTLRGCGTRTTPGQTLALRRMKSGYMSVLLYRDGKRSERTVHRLVLNAFRGECPPGHVACHWNDVPNDNRLENLRWASRSDNYDDAIRNGKYPWTRTHCGRGHEYTPGNTYLRPRGGRECRKCKAISRKTSTTV